MTHDDGEILWNLPLLVLAYHRMVFTIDFYNYYMVVRNQDWLKKEVKFDFTVQLQILNQMSKVCKLTTIVIWTVITNLVTLHNDHYCRNYTCMYICICIRLQEIEFVNVPNRTAFRLLFHSLTFAYIFSSPISKKV